MIIVNLIAMSIAVALLCALLIRTRGYDSIGWWLFRCLVMYCLVCFIYLAYDTTINGSHLHIIFLFIRLGCLALVLSMALSWYLIRKELRKQTACDFDSRIKEIFNLKDTP